jgi:predicted GH43/DUF377 family glycosyl hydrolase
MERSGSCGGTSVQEIPAAGAGMDGDLGRRLADNPLLTAGDVSPSDPRLVVSSVLNAAAVRVGDEVILLLRVGERVGPGAVPGPDARGLDLSGPVPSLVTLAPGYSPDQLVAIAVTDVGRSESHPVVAFIPRTAPDLDLSNPGAVGYRTAAGELSAILTERSHLRVARSRDGVHFQVDPRPLLEPSTIWDAYGCEDPRASLIDGEWQVTYVSVGYLGATTSRFSTPDFRSVRRHGLIFMPDQKDVVLFPGCAAGRYAALARPMSHSFGRVLGIWITFSDDLVHWGECAPLALPRPGMWDELRTGAGGPPFRVPAGWLEIYHGVDRDNRYALGALLLDGTDPSRVLARSPQPILSPWADYECRGLTRNVIFSCGQVPLDGDGRLIRVYYGGADSCVAAADFEVAAILDQLEPC